LFTAAGTCVKVATGVNAGTSPVPLSCLDGYVLIND